MVPDTPVLISANIFMPFTVIRMSQQPGFLAVLSLASLSTSVPQ